jgi:4'-phosphopantetheinyl transferase
MIVEVLLARIDPTGQDLPAHAWLCLTDEDRARAERFQRAGDRVRFVAARLLLRVALRRRFGTSDATLISPPGAKPSARGTGLPANLDVNLSHAGDLVACALGIGVSVGIDVEPIDRVVDAADIARAQFAPEEQESGRDTVSFLRMWTLKEAVAKAAGLGLALKLSAFACATDPPRLLRTAPELGPADAWRLESWEDTSHVVALAVRGATGRMVRPRCVDLAAP